MGFQLPSWLTSNPEVQAAVASAESAGKEVLAQSTNYAKILIGHIQTGFANTLPDVEGKVVNTMLDFVPEGARSDVNLFVSSIVSKTEAQINPAIIEKVNGILGTTLARLGGALNSTPSPSR